MIRLAALALLVLPWLALAPVARAVEHEAAPPTAADTAGTPPATPADPQATATTPAAAVEAPEAEATYPAASAGAAAFRLVLGLGGVGLAMAGSLAAYRWLLRRRPGVGPKGRQRILRPQVVSRTYLGAKESLCVVEVGRDRFLIATAPSGISCLGRLGAGDTMDLEPEEPRATDFARTLKRATAPAAAPTRTLSMPDESEILAGLARSRDRLAQLAAASMSGTAVRRFLAVAWLPLLVLACAGAASAQGVPVPKITIEAGPGKSPQEVSAAVEVLVLLTVLSVAPAILLMMTSFTRIVIVLSLLRQAVGVQQLPPNQVVIGLALFLTVFVMAPVGDEIHRVAVQPYLDHRISQTEALDRATPPLRAFMLRQTREADLALMVQMSKTPPPPTAAGLPMRVVIPAFALSEIKTSFQMGFVLFIPFLIIDLVVASVLMSMGMLMLPPAIISLPFKLLLFVLADGWHLVVRALVSTYR